MNFYTGGTGSGHKELTLHETAGATFRTKGTFAGNVAGAIQVGVEGLRYPLNKLKFLGLY